jgi:hypothetical protein
MKKSQAPTIRFSVLLENHILTTIQKKFSELEPSDKLLHEMRDTIIGCIKLVFDKSKQYRLSEKSIKWLANQFFKEVKLSTKDGIMVIGEHIVVNDYMASELPYEDVLLMSRLFNNMKFAPQLNEVVYGAEKRLIS